MLSVRPAGDCALILSDPRASSAALARAWADRLSVDLPVWVRDVSAAFGSICVCFDPTQLPRRTIDPIPFIQAWALQRVPQTADDVPAMAEEVAIPVDYSERFAPDLRRVANHAGLTVDQVVELHARAIYTVEAVGFLPGFAYLSGLDDRLHTPRLPEPRTTVPRGSVGIGGPYTGVYPLESPGGWNLIGRTQKSLFDPAQARPAVLAVGMKVRFKPIRGGR
jgi:KipI family sensor histidine kinase inhibitor